MSEQYSNLEPKYIQGILSTYKGNPTQIYSYRLNIYIYAAKGGGGGISYRRKRNSWLWFFKV